MAEKKKKMPPDNAVLLFAIILIAGELPHSCLGAKLNRPKILLPYFSSTPSSYQIEVVEAKGGCFTWRSSRPDVASVIANEDAACSNSATVTAVHRDPARVTTFLLAENKETGEMLRCDVIIDSITAIGVATTTRELYLEESPEIFQIWARDSEGNTFSTLDTTAFEWNLISDNEGDEDVFVEASQVLRIIPFEESSYDTPPHIEVMEAKGLQGDTILVEGVRTGSAKVRVTLKDNVYKGVSGAEVRLIVIANVMLSPLDAYILLFTSLVYQAHVIKQSVMHEIYLPSEQYHLEVKNQTVGSLDQEVAEVYAEALGTTQIILRDKHMPAKLLEAFHQPTSTLHVVLPAHIGFSIEPGKKWVLESGRVYEISVQVLDKDRHPIHLSKDVRLLTEFVSRYFDVNMSSENGSYHVVTAKVAGHTELKATLRSILKKDGTEYMMKQVVQGTQKLDIYNPIDVTPDILVFPWMTEDVVYSAQFKASGGSGDYVWSTNDTSIADVGPKAGAVVPVKTKNKIGVSSVTAADVRMSLHYDTSLIYVLPPKDMIFNPEYVEVEVGSYLDLPLGVFGDFQGERRQYTDCTKLPLVVNIDNNVFVYSPTSPPVLPADGVSCIMVRVLAKRSGHTVVRASYDEEGVQMEAAVTIAAFDPLVPVDPESSTLLGIETSRELTFRGGPLPWVLDKTKYFLSGTVDDESLVSLGKLKGTSIVHKVTVLCLKLGSQQVKVNVGNHPTATNKHPASRSASVRVNCKEPVGLDLRPQVPQHAGLPPCPITDESDVPIPVHNYRDLKIHVVVTDDLGNQFDNISTMHFSWNLSSSHLGMLDLVDVRSMLAPDADRAASPFIWYQTLTPHQVSGPLTISLLLNWKLNKELDIYLTEDAVMDPREMTLFNHPDSLAALQIIGGSGHFYVRHDNEELANVTHVDQSRQVLVGPRRDGRLVVEALDLCLMADDITFSVINISGANKIQLVVRDKVQQGNELQASVRVLDNEGKPLSTTHFELMNVQAKMDTQSQRYISVAPMHSSDPFTAMYKVTGVELGTAILSFVAEAQLGTIISSNAEDIQVFPPLRLEPRNVTVLVGAALQVQAVGGPHPQSSIKYSLIGKRDDVATVSGNGLVETSAVGSVRIRAEAIGIDDESGRRVVYSYDEGQVHVVKLMGIKLYAPLSRLQTNTKMPIYAMGLDEQQTPFSFANVVPPLSFQWSITNSEVAALQSVYHDSNIELPEESSFSKQLVTKREGYVTVKLRVSVKRPETNVALQQIHNNGPISDEAHIEVFDSLELISPSTCTGQLLMTPNTEARLKTNRDSAARMSYRVQGNRNLLTVERNGDMVSGSQPGSVYVLVTAVERFRTNQTLLLLVKIKPLSYIMLNCESQLHTTKPVDYIPVGSVLKYRVSSHDELGQRFDFTNSQIRFRANRFDLLQVTTPGSENGTVTVRAPSVSPNRWGGTVLKAWDVSQPRVADYVNINVQQAIDVSSTYTVGDVFCPTTHFISSDGPAGVWSSSNENVLAVDRGEGHSIALSPGTVSLSYNMSSQVTAVQVKVEEMDRLDLDMSTSLSLTLSDKPINIAVRINGAKATTCSETSRPPHIFPFECKLSADFSSLSSQGPPNVNSLFTAKPSWSSGEYGCTVTSLSLTSDIKVRLSSVQGSVTLTALNSDGQISSDSFSLPFLPPVHVHTKELSLSTAEPVAHVEVTATPDTIGFLHVKVEGRLSSLIHHASAVLDGTVYKIALRLATYSPAATDGSITLHDRVSDEVYEISVHVVSSNTTAGSHSSRIGYLLWTNTDLLIFAVICIVVTTICLLMGYFAVFGSRKVQQTPMANTSIFSGSSPPAGDGSPWMRQRPSPGRVALWSSGYEPQEVNKSDISLFKRSPRQMVTPD